MITISGVYCNRRYLSLSFVSVEDKQLQLGMNDRNETKKKVLRTSQFAGVAF